MQHTIISRRIQCVLCFLQLTFCAKLACVDTQLIVRAVITGKQLAARFADAANRSSRVGIPRALELLGLFRSAISKSGFGLEAPPALCHARPQCHPHRQPCDWYHHVEPAALGLARPDAAASRRTAVVRWLTSRFCDAQTRRQD